MKVPVFECMLADDSKKHEKKMTGEVYVEPKLDGVRVITICDVDKDEVKMFSRNGKELTNFPKIRTVRFNAGPDVREHGVRW
jgi:ATP-dependent DNA ligase